MEKRKRREAKAEGRDLDEISPITAVFELDEKYLKAVSSVFGEAVLRSKDFTVSRFYNNKYSGNFNVDESKAVSHLLEDFEIPDQLKALKTCKSFPALTKAIGDVLSDGKTLWQAVWRILFGRTPNFFYFAEYSSLPSSVNIQELLAADPKTLDDSQHTALALLQLAEFEKDTFLTLIMRPANGNWKTSLMSFGGEF